MKLKTRVIGVTALLVAAGLVIQTADWVHPKPDNRRGDNSVRFEVRVRPDVYVDITWRIQGHGGEHALRGKRAWAQTSRASSGEVLILTVTRPQGWDEKAVGYAQAEIFVNNTQVDFAQRNGVETLNLSYVVP